MFIFKYKFTSEIVSITVNTTCIAEKEKNKNKIK